MSAAEFYDALAQDYHLSYADWIASIHRQALALAHLLQRFGVPPGGSVLDAACGIGTQSLGLATLGYQMTASDLSPGAVERAREEAASRRLAISFSVADLRALSEHFRREFDAVIACDNAIPHLLSDAEIQTAFEQLYQCTAPGGPCLITVRDYAEEDRSTLPQARPPLVHSESGIRRILLQVWAFSGTQYELSVYVVNDDPEGNPTVKVMRTRYYAVTTDALLHLMRLAGFESVQRLDGVFYQQVIVGLRPRASGAS